MAKMTNPNLPDVTISVSDGAVPQYVASGWVAAEPAAASVIDAGTASLSELNDALSTGQVDPQVDPLTPPPAAQ